MKNLRKFSHFVFALLGLILILWIIFSLIRFIPAMGLGKKWEMKRLFSKALGAEKKGNFNEAIEYLEKIDEKFLPNKRVYTAWFNLALLYDKAGRLLEAKRILEKVVSESNMGKLVQEAQDRLGNLNIKILFSPLITEDSFLYEVKEGDSLVKLSQRFNTTVELLKQANNLKEDSLRVGMKLKVTQAKFSVLVDKSQNTLILKADDKVLKVYTVSTGLNNLTPVGVFKIVNKIVDPVWYKDGRAIPPGNPENILGKYWIGISQRGYGIHGTNQPETIGKHITRGCVRMYNQDVEELYIILPIGTEVIIME